MYIAQSTCIQYKRYVSGVIVQYMRKKHIGCNNECLYTIGPLSFSLQKIDIELWWSFACSSRGHVELPWALGRALAAGNCPELHWNENCVTCYFQISKNHKMTSYVYPTSVLHKIVENLVGITWAQNGWGHSTICNRRKRKVVQDIFVLLGFLGYYTHMSLLLTTRRSSTVGWLATQIYFCEVLYCGSSLDYMVRFHNCLVNSYENSWSDKTGAFLNHTWWD